MRNSYYNKELGRDEVIPLTFDNNFKLAFADPNHLERLNLLLTTVFKRKVKVVNLLNTDLLDDNRKNKKNSVDLVCELDGEYVSVEVNSSFGQKVIDRNLMFLFRIGSKDLKPGEDYKNIKKYYQININVVDFEGKHFEVCHLKGERSNKIVTDIIEIYYINVSYYAKLCYNKKGKGLSKDEIMYGTLGTDKKSVLEEITKKDRVLSEIGEIVKKYSEDDALIFEYNREKLMMDDMKEVLEKEMEKQMEKKIEKKIEKNTLDMARKMKDIGINISDISKVTELSENEIEGL